MRGSNHSCAYAPRLCTVSRALQTHFADSMHAHFSHATTSTRWFFLPHMCIRTYICMHTLIPIYIHPYKLCAFLFLGVGDCNIANWWQGSRRRQRPHSLQTQGSCGNAVEQSSLTLGLAYVRMLEYVFAHAWMQPIDCNFVCFTNVFTADVAAIWFNFLLAVYWKEKKTSMPQMTKGACKTINACIEMDVGIGSVAICSVDRHICM